MNGKSILLVISGGIAAYKSLELIRRLRERGVRVVPVMTQASAEFVTPLSVSALAGEKVYMDLFDLTDEADMGHIQLSRSADLIVVVPATADLMARMAHGRADDLASTLLLATDTPVLMVPAMNVRMWNHPATQRNLGLLKQDGVLFAGPAEGDMACGEYGPGRLIDVTEIVTSIEQALTPRATPLAGKKIIVTSGPTREPIDPVRYISNHSSGKQGHAIAAALAERGAHVVLVTGPVAISTPAGVDSFEVETATQMKQAVDDHLPADVVICAAAVADWRIDSQASQKMKKRGEGPPTLRLVENPDILQFVSQHSVHRPHLVIGFAAETTDIIAHAKAKKKRKGCDWILANDVSSETGTFGGEMNTIHFLQFDAVETWPTQDKRDVAARLADRIADVFSKEKNL